MRTHPRDKTLFQLKQSIATDKKRLEEYEREWRNSNMKDKRAKARMNNVMSLIRTAEFQLQRKSGELSHTVKNNRELEKLRKSFVTSFGAAIKHQWSEKYWLYFMSTVRNFVQNYNEL